MITAPQDEETEGQPPASDVNDSPQPDVNDVNGPPSESHLWCKPKMTASLSAALLAQIQAIAPGNVGNITQFIKWILEENSRLFVENHSLQENQDILNKIIRDKDIEIDQLAAELQQEVLKNTQPVEEEYKPVPAPAPAPVPTKRTAADDLFDFIGL